MDAISLASERQKGFSLVEMMVSLALGLLVILGATQVFLEGRESLSRVEALAWRQSNLNYVSSTMLREIRIANKDVAPVDSGSKVSISTNPGNLLIEFDEATAGYDPYCGSDQLVAVEYFKPVDSDSLNMQVKCSDGSNYDLYGGGGVEVIEGVVALEFRGDVTSGGSPYIEVDIRFAQLPGESAATADVDFMVANRKAVVESLN